MDMGTACLQKPLCHFKRSDPVIRDRRKISFGQADDSAAEEVYRWEKYHSQSPFVLGA
ncbi:hypothetical protein SDC9_183603 [bioreactor metagenome]|uniref:Uncharacterized protein n=1 Tax=bioreactor metagenome TaxID=1076179 RepID=A0A645HAP5_9ZZZZ